MNPNSKMMRAVLFYYAAFERTSQNSHVEVVVGTVFAVAAVTVGIMAGIFIYRKR